MNKSIFASRHNPHRRVTTIYFEDGSEQNVEALKWDSEAAPTEVLTTDGRILRQGIDGNWSPYRHPGVAMAFRHLRQTTLKQQQQNGDAGRDEQTPAA